jgi:hypothetical protein
LAVANVYRKSKRIAEKAEESREETLTPEHPALEGHAHIKEPHHS